MIITKKYGAERDKALADALALIEKTLGKVHLCDLAKQPTRKCQ